ncbi:uncharacterized protein LOC126792966 [Argentina anserina]|uniref:uncharacterized protein LOC126792966 n=1 Tax=Argentina anserina TaxID=57926 RepID=UPI002176739A|nr:uncharacterized protein LOC126792966 [Potentilla anserina]
MSSPSFPSSSSSSYTMCLPNSHFQSSSSNSHSPPSSPPPNLSAAGAGYIEHTVTKFDTLAGVAIKYGVEVADIRKMNGLVTDHQMFALRFLHIPLPGRHPPSHCLSNGSNTPGSQSSSDRSPRFTSRKASQAMNSLQSYYGLKARNQNSLKREILEMALCKTEGSHNLEGESLFGASHQPFSHYRKSKSLVKLDENRELSDTMPSTETREGDSDQLGKRIRRRQKSEADFRCTPEMVLEDNTASGGFSATAITGKCLALRPKSAANRTADVETGVPVGLGDSFLSSDASGVRKSSSTSNLQDHDTSCSASIWSTSKWTLKPDLQVFSTAAITKPIFDGLPKPMVGRRNKTALD